MTTEEEHNREELQGEEGEEEEERSMKLWRIGRGGRGGPDGGEMWKGSSMAERQRPGKIERTSYVISDQGTKTKTDCRFHGQQYGTLASLLGSISSYCFFFLICSITQDLIAFITGWA